MNFWHLKVFNEIMVSGTISQAAKNLKRTQSSISAALSNLEKQIGYDLFVRKNVVYTQFQKHTFSKKKVKVFFNKWKF